jgi:hypothetical protein
MLAIPSIAAAFGERDRLVKFHDQGIAVNGESG